MKSLTTMMEPLKAALTSVSDNVGHFEAIDRTTSFVIYAEDNEAAGLEANNVKEAQRIDVFVDAYILEPDLVLADNIQKALNDANIPFAIDSISYEQYEQYHFIRYRWRCEVD